MHKPTILAFDTSGPYCGVAVFKEGDSVASRFEEMQRGQAERLFPMLEDVMSGVGTVWGELDAIGVGIGPGNFTGIRIAVSAARGLSLSLNVPAIGVSGFDVVRHLLDGAVGKTAALLPAPKDQVYFEIADDGLAQDTGLANTGGFVGHSYFDSPTLISIGDPLPEHETYQIGETCINNDAPRAELRDFGPKSAKAIAHITANRYAKRQVHARPAPLYIRAADAAPSKTPPIKILP